MIKKPLGNYRAFGAVTATGAAYVALTPNDATAPVAAIRLPVGSTIAHADRRAREINERGEIECRAAQWVEGDQLPELFSDKK